VRERAMRGARWHNNDDEWWTVAIASLIDKQRPGRTKLRMTTAIPGVSSRFLARGVRGRRGKAFGGLGFGREGLYRRRGASVAAAVVRVRGKKWRGGECERVSEQGSKGGGVVLLIASQGSREERGPGGVDITRGDTATTG